MEYVLIEDTSIFAVNLCIRKNESGDIVYRDKRGRLHSVDFCTCAENYKAEHGDSSGQCTGERNMTEYSYVFYTSGIKTKIVFRRKNVSNIFRYHRLTGERASRFLELQQLIEQSGYGTSDLS